MSYCDIEIKGNNAFLSGDFSVPSVREMTSYPVQGANFSAAYKKGRWDGRKHLFNLKTSSMPSGLVTYVVAKLRERFSGIKLTVTDTRENSVPAAANRGLDVEGELKGKFGVDIYDFQMVAAEQCLIKKRGILKIATNGGKTAIAGAVTRHLSVPTLFVVPGIDLLHQSKAELAEYIGIPEDDIGVIGESNFSVGEWLTVATADSLSIRLDEGDLDDYKDVWQLVWVDECHTAGSDTLYKALDELEAYWRYGLSGTPLSRSDGATLRLIAQTGEVIHEVKNSLLVERGISVQPLVKFIRVDQPKIPKTRNKKKLTYKEVCEEAVIENPFLNDQVIKHAIKFINDGKQCIIMIDKLLQGETLDDGLAEAGIDGTFVHGKIKGKERKEAYSKFVAGEYRYLVGTSVLNQGLNMNCIDVLFFAGGGKAAIPTLQRSGRGLRSGKGRTELIIVDMINTCHKWMTEHTQKRIDTYKQEECFLMSMIDEETDFTTGG